MPLDGDRLETNNCNFAIGHSILTQNSINLKFAPLKCGFLELALIIKGNHVSNFDVCAPLLSIPYILEQPLRRYPQILHIYSRMAMTSI